MKIDNHNNLFSALFHGKKETSVKPSNDLAVSPTKRTEKDTIQVSDASSDILRYMNKLSKEEAIRYEKVDAIQSQIEKGDYHISGKHVVAKLLEGK